MELSRSLYALFENQALSRQERTYKNLSAEGTVCRSLREKGKKINLWDIFDRSLLGPSPREAQLSPYERDLLHIRNYKAPIRIGLLMDLDGVIANPYIDLCYFRKRTPSNRMSENLNWMAIASDQADFTIVSTNRLLVSDELKSRGVFRSCEGNGELSRFPFIDETTITRIERRGQGKLAVIPNKWTHASWCDVREIVKEEMPDMLYAIGSSGIDGRIAKRFVQEGILEKEQLVFFDTGHFLI